MNPLVRRKMEIKEEMFLFGSHHVLSVGSPPADLVSPELGLGATR